MLTVQTNRQYAYAVVVGGLDRESAANFNVWVQRNRLGTRDPVDNLNQYLQALEE